jgi:nitrite reductase/ring-hydroxylating ferredoxin subunit
MVSWVSTAESIRLENVTLPADGHSVRVVANGNPVAIFRVGDGLYGLDARCTHVGGPLDQGSLVGFDVTCPLHHSIFDVRDGKVIHGPASRPATVYRVRTEGKTVVLERD